VPGSLLACVLLQHARHDSGAGQQAVAQQLSGAAALMELALKQDVRAAFAVLPSLLAAAAADSACTRPLPAAATAGGTVGAAMQQLAAQVQQMLLLDAQRLLRHALPVVGALSAVAARCPAADKQAMLAVLDVTQRLAAAADSWHEAVGASGDSNSSSQVVSQPSVPTAAALVRACLDAAPAWAFGCKQAAAAGDAQLLLPLLADVLQAAAQLSDTYLPPPDVGGLQPHWVERSADAAATPSAWQEFVPLVVAAAQGSSDARDAAMGASDTAAAASALLALGAVPSGALLQQYLAAVGSHALGLTAPGLCQLLWTLAGMATSQASGTHSRADVLQLASAACSSLAVRSRSSVSAQQLARATWAVAALSAAAGAEGGASLAAPFTPSQQTLTWLRRSWQHVGATLHARTAAEPHVSAEAVSTQALCQAGVLHGNAAADLQWAWEQLQLLPALQSNTAGSVSSSSSVLDEVSMQDEEGDVMEEAAASSRVQGVPQQQRVKQQQQQRQQQQQQEECTPPFVAELLASIRAGGFAPTHKQALQALLPAQQCVANLPPHDVLCLVQACFSHSVPVAPDVLQAAAAAAVQASQEAAHTPVATLQQLLSAIASTVLSADSGSIKGRDSAAHAQLCADARTWLQQLLPLLPQAAFSRMSAAELLQLLRDVVVMATGNALPKASKLDVGSGLFGATGSAVDTPATAAAAGAVDAALLAAVAAALAPKLLLLPHGSQVLQSLQLLQALGLRQPGGPFMASFFAAADALLDTFAARNCLELLAVAAAAGHMPSAAQATAVLQHLEQSPDARLSPSEVAGGCRLLAALGIRPSAGLLERWFSSTQAAAERMAAVHVQQMLWACCAWQVLPPSDWLHAVLAGLTPAGRLSACSPATLAGICRCLWQLGVQPAPGVVAAIVAAAQQRLAHVQDAAASALEAESLSVLCYCLSMWGHEGTPAWRAAVAHAATALLPVADGPSLLRLGVCLSDAAASEGSNDEGDDEQQQQSEAELQAWQQALLEAVVGLLPASEQEAQLGVGQASGSGSYVQLLPPWGLVILCRCLEHVPVSSLRVMQALAAAVQAEAALERLSTWDIMCLLPHHLELLELLQEQAAAASGPMAPLMLRQLQQQAQAVQEAAQSLVKVAYQQRDGAPAAALQMLPVMAEGFGIDMPRQSAANLEASIQDAQARERQLQTALLLQLEGGDALPDSVLAGFAELSRAESMQLVALYGNNPPSAAFARRMTWLGGAVSEGWVCAGLGG
jgi:hypothetical protein